MLFPKGDKHMEFEEFLYCYLSLDEDSKYQLDLFLREHPLPSEIQEED